MTNEKTKVLVVDDELEIVDTLKSFLTRKGYDVTGALSGEEALSFLEKKRTDLILLDLKMPGIRGEDVARIVKEKYPATKIIVVTAYSEDGKSFYKENLLEDVLIKPVSLKELYAKLLEVSAPDRDNSMDADLKQGTMARMLLIKAKLLFVEPSIETYNFLNIHFKGLSSKGEDYEMDAVHTEAELMEKITGSQADVLAVNISFLKNCQMDLFSKIQECNFHPKEIIIYNMADSNSLVMKEIERLTKAIEIVCVKNGLIEIKWMEI